MRPLFRNRAEGVPHIVDKLLGGAIGIVRLFRFVDPVRQLLMNLPQLAFIQHHRIQIANFRRLSRSLRHDGNAACIGLAGRVWCRLYPTSAHPLKFLNGPVAVREGATSGVARHRHLADVQATVGSYGDAVG